MGRKSGFKGTVKAQMKQKKAPGIYVPQHYPNPMTPVSYAAFQMRQLVILAFFPPWNDRERFLNPGHWIIQFSLTITCCGKKPDFCGCHKDLSFRRWHSFWLIIIPYCFSKEASAGPVYDVLKTFQSYENRGHVLGKKWMWWAFVGGTGTF